MALLNSKQFTTPTSLTGSLFGTASYSDFSATASYVISAPTTPTLDQVTTAGNTTTNNVSVGSTLTVGDWSTRSTNVYIRAATGGSQDRGYYIGLGSGNDGNKGSLTHNPDTNFLSLRSAYNAGTIALSLEGNTNSVQFHNTSGTVVSKFVSSTGNLLIGTTTDSGYKLDVNGSVRLTNNLTTSSYFRTNGIASDGRMALYGTDTNGSIQLLAHRGNFAGGAATLFPGVVSTVGLTGAIGFQGSQLALQAHVIGIGVTNSGTHKSLAIGTPNTSVNSGFGGNTDTIDIGTFSSVSNTWGGTRPSITYTALAHNFKVNNGTGQNNPGTSALYIDSGSNVGISTNNPTYKLDVSGSGRFTDGLIVTGSGNIIQAAGANPFIKINDTSAASRSQLYGGLEIYDSTGALGSYFKHINSANLEIRSTAGDVAIGTFADAGLLYLDGDKVGVSTSSPAYKLDVSGSARFTDGITVSGSTTIQGNVTIYGTASVDVLVTNYQSSSIIYSSGSTKFGDTLDDTHEFTGSLYVTGSDAVFSNDITVNSLTVGRGSGNVASNTAVGYQAAYSNTGGTGLTAMGSNALFNNETGINNSAFGFQALSTNTTGNYNVGIGTNSLVTNTTGNGNTAVGYQAGYSNTTGGSNISVGYQALRSNSTGNSNIAIGGTALRSNTASNNTAVGHEAAYSNTSGTQITAIGYQALKNSTGVQNTALGYQSALNTTTGQYNTAIGSAALTNNLIANNNTAIGYAALNQNLAGNNTAVGFEAARLNISGSNITAVGYQSLQANTTGDNNTAIGRRAMFGTTSGGSNVAIGYNSLYSNDVGSNNTAIGYTALLLNTANANTAVGYQAAYLNTTGTGVTAVGYQALRNSTGSNNTAVGYGSMYNVTTGDSNTALGYNTLRNLNTGGTNVAIGFQAGDGVTNTASSIFIGYNSDASVLGISSGIAIGASAIAGSNDVVIGASANATGNQQNNVVIGRNATTSGATNTIIGVSSATTGNSNTLIGAGSNGSTFSSSIIIGRLATATASNQFVVGSASHPAGTVSTTGIKLGQAWQVKVNGTDYQVPLTEISTDYALDVTGSGNYSGDLTVTGSLNVTLAADINLATSGSSALIHTTNGERAGIFRRTEVSQSAGVNYNIDWDANGYTIPQFSYSSGVFTNTSSKTRTFVFSMQVAVQAVSTGYGEADIWFSQGGTYSGTNRYGQVAYAGAASGNQILSTSWTFILTPNDTVRCYVWADQAYRIGHAAFGNSANYSCKLQVSEII